MVPSDRGRLSSLAAVVDRVGREPKAATLAWTLLGLGGSTLVALAGPGLVDHGVITWWYSLGLPPGRAGNMIACYLGMAALSVAWLGLGERLRRAGRPGTRQLWAIGAAWCLPLGLGPSLFSSDVYSYMAQGMILHLGHSPYHDAPAVLAHLGEGHLLDAVSPFWRHTTAPYGPLFLGIASVLVGALHGDLVAGVLALRVLELAGVALCAVFVPRLARLLGADPALSTWLVVLSPLTLLELVAAGHNDALMAGLMVAGVTLALERRPYLGAALCALAATVKLPALAGVAFIVVATGRERAGAREGRGAREGVLFALTASALALAVLAAVSALTGAGAAWVSPSVISTPGKVHLAVTPTTALGWTAGSLLHAAGIAVRSRSIESALGDAALAATAVLGLVLLRRVRLETLVTALAALLLLVVAAGPATWPWYFAWGLSHLATCRGPQRSRLLALAIAAIVFEVKPDGILGLPLQAAPAVLAGYVLLAGAAWVAVRCSARRRAGAETEQVQPLSGRGALL